MRDIIDFILGNFTLTFFVIGLVASAIAIWRAPAPRSSALIVEELFAYLLLFSIGFSYLYNFVMHVFFGKLAASSSDGRTARSSWRSALRAWALPRSDFWRSRAASICG